LDVSVEGGRDEARILAFHVVDLGLPLENLRLR
jgi:hypothetical protein